ncbi:S8 family serine peptidase, partial [Patulibacter sp. S7RM1-6]
GVPADGPASLSRVGGRVVTEIAVDGSAWARADAIRAAGGRVLNVSTRAATVTAAIDPSDLATVGGLAGVDAVREVRTPIVWGAPDAASRATGTTRAAPTCPTGSVTSQGVAQLEAGTARATYGVDGSGVTVGVLSDSYDLVTDDDTNASGDIATGDLPGAGNPCGQTTGVNVLDDTATQVNPNAQVGDEGRAMTQIVHDVAPGARLAFASAYNGEQAFADNIRRLQAAGASVITDDVGYFDEPFFQDGPIAQAISAVRAQGASYYTAAGNANAVDAQGNAIGSWESAALRPTQTAPTGAGASGAVPAASSTLQYEDFDPGTTVDTSYAITVPAGASIILDLQWAQPRGGVTTDLDAYLHDAQGRILRNADGTVAASAVDNTASMDQHPSEILAWDNTGSTAQAVQLSIARDSSGRGDKATPRLKFIVNGLDGTGAAVEYPTGGGVDTVGPTVFGHAGAADAVSVAAVNSGSTSALEPYSSRGPVTTLFGPTRTDGTAAATLAAPQTRSKPDLAATDCVSTTFFYGSGHTFCGTSAAAPHAAAVDALVRSATPGLSVDQAERAVRMSGRPVGTQPATAAGAGLVDARTAVA